ncbi:MAG: 2-phospho-L-lactate transferase CofD family protein, partial [Actinomycetota bacterium]|nr:2-phospho-L-lactate transferase CofD family protein [Actinomycetota bacterium]
LIGAHGNVYPATTALIELGARVEGGEVEGQVAVAQTRAPIEAVYITPADPPAHPPAVAAIRAADQIVLGPGSLFTSLIATLSVPGIVTAVRESRAVKVFVCNGRRQKGETEGLDASAHLDALRRHAGDDIVDAMIVHSPVLAVDGIEVDAALRSSAVRLIEAEVVRSDGAHDPARLAEVLAPLRK